MESHKNAQEAKNKGLSEIKAKSTLKAVSKNEISGEKQDEFYLRVKSLLDSEGEVSDAIGRLCDKEYYSKLSYEEKQRYNFRAFVEIFERAFPLQKRKRDGDNLIVFPLKI